MGDPSRGLYDKFTVRRTDGQSARGGKHHDCQYFVLDLTHDKHAWPALAGWRVRHEQPITYAGESGPSLYYFSSKGGA